MATLVSFHAHPDDESIATGGVLAKAADDGHRVVLVLATRGEHGEVDDGFLDDGEELWQRRVQETYASAEALGVHRVEFLGYVDSGMVDTAENDLPGSFWSADVEEAAGRLAAILREEQADVLTVYDDHGAYGHPDHIQVHRVGMLAAAKAGTPRVYQSTINRDRIIELMKAAPDLDPDFDSDLTVADLTDDPTFGTPEDQITCRVDVRSHLHRKRASMQAHASQISETHFMLAMSDEMFAMAFGDEWFIRDGQGPGITETEIL
jgi:LmbE family N-acetylglucosaminyl deacetylase